MANAFSSREWLGCVKWLLKWRQLSVPPVYPGAHTLRDSVFPLPFFPPATQLRHLLIETALCDAAAVFSLEDKSHSVRKAEVEDRRPQASWSFPEAVGNSPDCLPQDSRYKRKTTSFSLESLWLVFCFLQPNAFFPQTYVHRSNGWYHEEEDTSNPPGRIKINTQKLGAFLHTPVINDVKRKLRKQFCLQ